MVITVPAIAAETILALPKFKGKNIAKILPMLRPWVPLKYFSGLESQHSALRKIKLFLSVK